MARIPNFPFRVIVTQRLGATQQQTSYNEENIVGAMARRDMELRRDRTKRVQIVLIIDESTPDHHLDESTRYQRNANRMTLNGARQIPK